MRRPMLALFALLACTPAPEAAPSAKEPTTKTEPATKAEPTTAAEGPRDPPTEPARSELLDPASFDQRCETDADCIGIETMPCRKCGCVDAAIAAKDRERLATAVAEIACEPGGQRKCRCSSLQPWCDQGKCGVRPPQAPPEPEPPKREPTKAQAVDMSKFKLSCKRDADCTNVRPSPCGHCGCSSTPLRVEDEDAFIDARAKIVCAPEPPDRKQISCGGCPGYAGVCKQGKCAIEVR